MNISRMNQTQQYFQIIVAAMRNELVGQINLSDGDTTISATVDGKWLVLNFSNGTDVRTLHMGWTDDFNTSLRKWMFGILDLWDRHAIDAMVADEIAQEAEIEAEHDAQVAQDEMEAEQKNEQKLNNPWADRWDGYQDGHDAYEDAAIRHEAQEARDMDTGDCIEEGCNGTTFYRPGVGGWWCEACGELAPGHMTKVTRNE